MDRKMFLSILAMAVFGFIGIMLLLPEENRHDDTARLPWLVDQDAEGRTRVFGLALGKTSLGEIRTLFGEEGEINLFAHLDGERQASTYRVEAYFEQIYLNRLRADFVFTLLADQATLAQMYEHGLRISQVGSGAKKVKLDPADLAVLADLPIGSITYLPWKSLDAAIVEKRFGTPQEKRLEPQSGITHWLYPDKGMDLAMDKKGGVVIQYVNRGEFGSLLAPLAAANDTQDAP